MFISDAKIYRYLQSLHLKAAEIYVPYYCQQAKNRNVFVLKEFNTVHLYLPQYSASDDKQRGKN